MPPGKCVCFFSVFDIGVTVIPAVSRSKLTVGVLLEGLVVVVVVVVIVSSS